MSNRANTILRSPLMVLSVVAAMFAASADKAYSAPINIHEDVSARQVIPGAGAVDYALTRYVFENNTDVELPTSGVPENMNLGEVLGFYSTGLPITGQVQNGWGYNTIEFSPDFWGSIFNPTTSEYEITPGDDGIYEVVSKIPKGTTPIYGDITAQAHLAISGEIYSETVTGVVPEPATISLLALGGLALLVRRIG